MASIKLPDDINYIGDSAFQGCSSLASIKLPDDINYIEDSVFQACSSLASIEIPNGVGGIGINAFRNCSSLASVEIPDSVTVIGNYAFEGCGETLHIYCNEGSYAETYAKENSICYQIMKKVQTITASDFTKTTGDSAFPIGAATDGDGALSYQSSNDSVASVSPDGTVTIAGEGTAIITITASETNDFKAAEKQITITVNPK